MAAAPALAPAGIDVQAHEQAHQLTETSADVSLAPNGLRMLKRLGVGEGSGGSLPRLRPLRQATVRHLLTHTAGPFCNPQLRTYLDIPNLPKGTYVMAITIAEKVLIVGGVLNLAYGTLLGYPITVIRAKGAPATPRYLMATHISTLLHAAVLLGLAWAARLSALGPGWHDVAAWLLVVSSALIAAKDTLNWLTGVQDEFGEKAKTAPLGALGALGETVGVGIFVAGILTAL